MTVDFSTRTAQMLEVVNSVEQGHHVSLNGIVDETRSVLTGSLSTYSTRVHIGRAPDVLASSAPHRASSTVIFMNTNETRNEEPERPDQFTPEQPTSTLDDSGSHSTTKCGSCRTGGAGHEAVEAPLAHRSTISRNRSGDRT